MYQSSQFIHVQNLVLEHHQFLTNYFLRKCVNRIHRKKLISFKKKETFPKHKANKKNLAEVNIKLKYLFISLKISKKILMMFLLFQLF